MPAHLNPWFDTPFKRFAGMGTAFLLFALLVRLTEGTHAHPVVLATIPGAIALILLRRVWRQRAALKRQIIRREIRLVQSWYAVTARPPVVLALHSLGISLAFMAFAATVAAGKRPGDYVMGCALSCLALAGFCDVVLLISRVSRLTWAPIAGKVLAVTLCIALAAVSLVLAKDVAHGVTHIDPKYLGDVTTLLTCFILPLVYVGAVAAVLTLNGAAQMLLFGVLALTSTALKFLLPVWPARPRKSWAMTWYRLRHGRCPAGGVLPPARFMSHEDILRVSAPLSKLTLAAGLLTVLHLITTGVPVTSPLFARLIVSMEYRPGSGCVNLDQALSVAYMEDGYVSVAYPGKNGLSFSTLKCQLGVEK